MKVLRSLVLLLCLAGVIAADWPQLLGPARNGHSTETGLLNTWPAGGPEIVWQRDVGDGYASPVISAGRLVLFHRLGNEDTTECLDATTGKLLWKQAYRTNYRDPYGKGNGPRSTPVVADGKVFTLGASGFLQCVDVKTGKPLWSKALHEVYTVKPSFFGVGSTPIVDGKRLLINVGGEGAGIVALDTETGKEVWKATEQDASYSSPILATVSGVRHAIFLTREGLVSLDPADGKVRFSRRFRSRIDASVNAATPVLIGEDHLFLSACYDTGALLLKIGKDSAQEVWKNNDSMSCHFSTPVVVGDHLFGFDGRQEGEGAKLRCIEWKNGKVCWTEDGYGCGSIVVADGKLLILSEGGKLVLADPSGKQLVIRSSAAILGQTCRAHLALANGLVYARDEGKLVCVRVKKP